MKRVNVVGITGSGKSTLSKALAEKLGCPYIQMDQLYWKANWQGTEDEEFFAKVDAATSGESWVLDGNYNRTSYMKWQKVDTIIWVDYSYIRTFLQLFRRTFLRAWSGGELWEGTGNESGFRKSFMSKDSILLWFFKNYWKIGRRYSALENSPEIEGIEFIRLRSPKEFEAFLAQVK